MSDPIRLYTVKEIAHDLGVRRQWLHNRMNTRGTGSDPDVPRPQYTVSIGGKDPIMLWSEEGVAHWHAYAASQSSVPKQRTKVYSDHRAVNPVHGSDVTWKLWWRCSFDGGTLWWFSTPDGWYTSDDDGLSWRQTGLMMRPNDYRYQCVNGSVKPSAAVNAILRSATALRKRLEEGSAQ